jgi:glycosyltransferase involved in cell wall biosynthesis
MDICMFSPFSSDAPSTYRILSFARQLTKEGHGVTAVLPSFDKYSGFKLDQPREIDGVKFLRPFQFKTKKTLTNFASYTFSAILSSVHLRCDVLHILKPMPMTFPGFTPKILRGVPAIQDIDDLDHAVMAAEGYPAVYTWSARQCERVMPGFADHLVVSNSALRELYSNMGFEQKISQIPNGVSVDDFKVDKDTGIKERLALKERVVVYVGSLNNQAQLQPLLLSMRKVVDERKDVSCLIVGDGAARQSLQALANSLGLQEHVVFAGKVDHAAVPRFLSVSDLGFACFPRLEYLRYVSNIKVFEYLAAGVPAIVSSTGDLPSYIDYGNAGKVVEPNPSDLAKAMLELLGDQKTLRRLSCNGREHVKRFDWKVLTQKLLQVYRSCGL